MPPCSTIYMQVKNCNRKQQCYLTQRLKGQEELDTRPVHMNPSPPQSSPHHKAWDNWQESLTYTYNTTISLSLSSSLKLETCHVDAHPAGWVYYKQQDRVWTQTRLGWKSYRPVIRRQGRSSNRRFRKAEGDINVHLPVDSFLTLAEDLSSDIINKTGIGGDFLIQTNSLEEESP